MIIDEFVQKGYTYLEIPEEWMCLYHKLLTYLADFGEDALKECETACTGKHKNIIKCWGLFQSALAARSLGKDKLANTLIKYIEAQLELVYKGEDKEEFNGGFILPVDETGHVYGLMSCANNIQFYVHHPLEEKQTIVIDEQTQETMDFYPGRLYVRLSDGKSKHRDFYINEKYFNVIFDKLHKEDMLLSSNLIVESDLEL